ncbi:DoxX family protein [Flavobacteriaceae bacterium]|nr:DoxX family protein [Flavobacteriaceae bacterium]MDA8923479.1 DoxX family protein [Flavobacteriaceae bacterium]MDA9244774.1 DoxX family protein [Flavobacteriaceae bacterium]MDA9295017.1 DoxX family protein [Flavobacteriaceae bacterium]MDA9886371.1 DoxX family protein [Flavobacteriaceae bacterium]
MQRNTILFSTKSYTNTALLLGRAATGFLMVKLHGWSKLMAGTDRWEGLGSKLAQTIGLDFMSIPLGFMASFAESIAAILLILGLTTRPAAFLLAFTMMIASIKKLEGGLKAAELPLLFLLLSLIILLCGAGKYSLDHRIFRREK